MEETTTNTTQPDAVQHEIIVSSFGHCYGATPGAHVVLNARKIQNPGAWARNSTGLNKKVRDAVMLDNKAISLVEQGVQLIQEIVSNDDDREEGIKNDKLIHVAIGCDKGRHRSVVIANEIAAKLQGKGFHATKVQHRDIHKSSKAKRKNQNRKRDAHVEGEHVDLH
jgi:UPF0042 nucleotide-binding protein